MPIEDRENDTTNYAPVFEFVAADGRTYTVTSGTASNPPAYGTGEIVRVLYLPHSPTHARLKGVMQLWLFPLISGPLGAFYALIGGVLLWFDRRYQRRLDVTVARQ